MNQYLKIVFFLFTITFFMPAYSALEVIKAGFKGFGNEISAQALTSTAWMLVYEGKAIKNAKSFEDEATNFETNLRKKDGSPKTPYKIGRTIFNIGDFLLNPQLPLYVAKKISDLLITDGIGNLAYYAFSSKPEYIRHRSNTQESADTKVRVAQIPFRDIDEIWDWEQEGKSKILYTTIGSNHSYTNRFNETDNLPTFTFLTFLRCLVKGTLGHLITRQIYTKLFPYLGAKLAPQGRTMKVLRTLDAAFSYTHPINLFKKLKVPKNLLFFRKTA
jgi:hypothetical protein